MRTDGGTNGHPFRVTLDQHQLVDALAQRLPGNNISVQSEDGSWTVSIDGAKTDQLVLRVLDAIRDTLAAQPSASALVQLDGQEYVMRGEDHFSTSPAQAPTVDEIAEPGSDAGQELPPQTADSAPA